MELACESGLTPSEFWECTIPEILSMVNGYEKRLYQQYSMNRSLRYALYCLTAKNPIDIFDWEPLEGDPTKEEIEKMKLRQQMHNEQNYLETRRFYESRGIEVM